ncbi:MAG: thioredoxin-disulfide reductase [Candidatus Aminicenantes bacterium]|nr:thioredoxin-disulfide reductase [Candidatus Aminicenantes bacterium]
MPSKHDVVIIGAGPAGLAAAIYTGRARLNTIVLEKGLPGGQILITDWVENYPGFPDGIAPFDLIESFRKQVLKFGAVIVADAAKSIRPDGNGPDWIVQTGKAEYAARAIIVATGAQYRRLGLPNEGRLIGRGVSYCATCDGAFFRDREIAVVGGGDTALMEAHYLTKFASTVHVIHRRDRFRGAKILQERLLGDARVKVHWDSVVDEIVGTENLEAVVLRCVKDDARTILPIEGLFVSIGMDPINDPVKGLVEINEWGEIVTDAKMGTSRTGIYAAGDVIDSTPHQVATAVGTGVHAAMRVGEYLSGYK